MRAVPAAISRSIFAHIPLSNESGVLFRRLIASVGVTLILSAE